MSTSCELDVPSVEEIQRVIDDYFASRSLEIAYAVLEGDGPSDSEDLSEYEQERVMKTALRYMWLKAVRKRIEQPI
jgi:hypothetical protein